MVTTNQSLLNFARKIFVKLSEAYVPDELQYGNYIVNCNEARNLYDAILPVLVQHTLQNTIGYRLTLAHC